MKSDLRAFTLPETIVALSLFSIAAMVLCQSAINARSSLERVRQLQPAHQRVDWIRKHILAITDRAVLEEGGELDYTAHVRKTPKSDEEAQSADAQVTVRARWEAEVFPTPVLDVHQIVIEYTIDEGEQVGAPATCSYYVYRPGWYEEDNRNSLLTEKREERDRDRESRGI
jgi:prepilin-type N-terminal cleavage/methylation domain-containing protein